MNHSSASSPRIAGHVLQAGARHSGAAGPAPWADRPAATRPCCPPRRQPCCCWLCLCPCRLRVYLPLALAFVPPLPLPLRCLRRPIASPALLGAWSSLGQEEGPCHRQLDVAQHRYHVPWYSTAQHSTAKKGTGGTVQDGRAPQHRSLHGPRAVGGQVAGWVSVRGPPRDLYPYPPRGGAALSTVVVYGTATPPCAPLLAPRQPQRTGTIMEHHRQNNYRKLTIRLVQVATTVPSLSLPSPLPVALTPWMQQHDG